MSGTPPGNDILQNISIAIPDLDDMDDEGESSPKTVIPSSEQIKKTMQFQKQRDKEIEHEQQQLETMLKQSSTTYNRASSIIRPSNQKENQSVEAKVSSIHPVPVSNKFILAKSNQKNNPIIQNISHMIQFHDALIPDFVINDKICIIYLSMRFHIRHQDYLEYRMDKLRNLFNLRVVLCEVDLHFESKRNSPQDPNTHIKNVNQATEYTIDKSLQMCLEQITKTCLKYSGSLMLSFSKNQSTKYLELYRYYADKPPNLIKTKVENEYLPILRESLTKVRSVNKTDVMTLLRNFGSFKGMVSAKKNELLMCPGLGTKKCNRLFDAFHAPFLVGNVSKASKPSLSEAKESKKKQIQISQFLTQDV